MTTLQTLVLLAALSLFTPAAAGNEKADINNVTVRFEKEILNCVQKNAFREAGTFAGVG